MKPNKAPTLYVCPDCGQVAKLVTKPQLRALLAQHGDDLARMVGVTRQTLHVWRRWAGVGVGGAGATNRAIAAQRHNALAQAIGFDSFPEAFTAMAKTMTTGEIADELGITVQCLGRIRRAYGLPPASKRLVPLNPADHSASLEARARAKGARNLLDFVMGHGSRSRQAVARALGCNPDSLTKALRRKGVTDYFEKNSPKQRAAAKRNLKKANAARRANTEHPWGKR